PGMSKGSRAGAGCCWITSRSSSTCSTKKLANTTCSIASGATLGAWILVWQALTEGLAEALRSAGLFTPERASRIELAIPRDPAHGDWTTNLALLLAREVGKPPRVVAEALAAAFPLDRSLFAGVEVAGAGFLNFRYSPTFLRRLATQIRNQGA